MLFLEGVFSGFTNNAISDTAKGSEVLFSLGADSRDQVDDIANRARSAGGTVFAELGESHGLMYGCGFCDPDGYRWNLRYLDASKMPQQ
jgi:predicted lactoylglutathione lyase